MAEICRRLDGLPLAIELAAARVKLFTPATLLARLDRRLPLLIGGPRDAPPRLRTMRDAIAWSYDLLPPDARTLFRRLAVFAGGFSLEAAEVIGASEAVDVDVTHELAVLLDASIVRRDDAAGGERAIAARYAMLETIREFGLEMLEANHEAALVRAAHAAYYLDLAEKTEWELARGQADHWLDRLTAEQDN